VSVKKVLLVLFALFVVGAIGLGVLVALLVPRYVEREVLAEAEARGIQLIPGEISFGFGWLQISDAKLSLIGVPGLKATVSIVDVELKGMVPLRFTVNDLKADAVGEPVALLRALDAWRSAHEKSFTEPVFIKPLIFTLRDAPKAEPLLSLSNAEMRIENERSSLRAEKLRFLGRELGATSVNVGKGAVHLGVTLGMSALENPLVTLDVQDSPKQTLHLGLSPVSLGKLGSFLGKELPLPEVLLSGALDATQAPNTSPPAGVSGRADFTLKNYVPPHPAELDGFVFGNATDFGATFTLEPEKSRVRLEQALVKAGNFVLEGAGELRLEGTRGRLILLLRGQLPCNLLAGAAAETRLGRALGRLTGKAAREVLSGSVGIRVAVDADPTDLPHARALKTISPGCGLKPLSLNELQALGELLPDALDPAVAKDLDTLLKNPLPALPNLGPDTKLNLPNLNALPLPQLQLPAPPRTGTKAAPKAAPSAGR
jgi:ADP-dependent NAD(P)H-hydrate dehydratase / NAD(P)H-hydrate epimerase